MYVLAVDPGVHTGVALLTADDVVWAETFMAPYEDLGSTLSYYSGTPCVCEEAPTVHKHEADTYDRVTSIVKEHPDVTFLSPSQWKGHPSTRLSASDKAACRTKHEREAACLGRRFLAMRRSDDRQANVSTGGNA